MKEYNGNYMAFGPRPDLEKGDTNLIKSIRETTVNMNLSDVFWDSKKSLYDKLDLSNATRQDIIHALASDADEFIKLHDLKSVDIDDLVNDFMDRR